MMLLAGGASSAWAQSDPSPTAPTPLIVGGQTVTQRYPAMASLQTIWNGDPNFHICGATLIHPRYLLVNAHCVTNDDGTAMRAALFHAQIGSADRTRGGTLALISAVLPHADWAWGTGGGPTADMALLRLDRKVPVRPLPIGGPRADRPGVRLLGWGLTDPAGTTLPTGLQQLDTTRVDPRRCAAGGITAGEICVANAGTAGACFGDSGGPALTGAHRRWHLLGAASRETHPTCGAAPSIYTDIRFYHKWIKYVVRTGAVPPPATTRTTAAPTGPDGRLWAGVHPRHQ